MSVYYSHALQLLFFSYCQGRSFAATISRTTLEVLQLFSISIKRWGSALSLELPQRPVFSRGAPPPPGGSSFPAWGLSTRQRLALVGWPVCVVCPPGC